jgi:hypothetical protein
MAASLTGEEHNPEPSDSGVALPTAPDALAGEAEANEADVSCYPEYWIC